jgi:hypothetical protein
MKPSEKLKYEICSPAETAILDILDEVTEDLAIVKRIINRMDTRVLPPNITQNLFKKRDWDE